MDIFAFIEKLQKKPESERRKILLVSVISIMIIIIAVWLTTIRLNFQNEGTKNIAGPFEFIKQDIKDFYGLFKGTTK